MTLFFRLGWFFRAHRATYLAALAMLAGVAALNMAIPWLVARAVDRLVTATSGLASVYPLLLLLLGAGVAIYLLRYGWRKTLYGTSYRLGHHLRRRFYQRLCTQGQAFYATHNTGDLMARATNDIDAIEMAAGEGILSGFDGLMTFVLVLLMMFVAIDWRLALVALIPFPIMGWQFYRISSAIHHQFQKALEAFSALNDRTQEAMTGIRLVRAMGLEQQQDEAFGRISSEAADTNYQVARSEAKYEPVVFLCMSASLLLTLGYGAWLIHARELSVGQLTGFTLYLSQLIWPMFAFGWLLNIVERGSAALKRVDALLDTPDTVHDSGTATPADTRLTVDQLAFRYADDQAPALQGVSFQLAPGQLLGIAGPTGGGKTTLLQLLMRYWEIAPAAAIRLGEKALADYRLPLLRQCFAYVPQDPFLFSLSIADNIALGRPDASPEQIREAARLADIDGDIARFPRGYDTPVGERGVTLSGGQRQRIAIARALLTAAPILILDDALSAVDLATEQRILNQLRQVLQQRTAIIVSHRLSSLRDADLTLVLAHGEVLERGRHSQLLALDGWYARMWTYQQLEEELEQEQPAEVVNDA